MPIMYIFVLVQLILLPYFSNKTVFLLTTYPNKKHTKKLFKHQTLYTHSLPWVYTPTFHPTMHELSSTKKKREKNIYPSQLMTHLLLSTVPGTLRPNPRPGLFIISLKLTVGIPCKALRVLWEGRVCLYSREGARQIFFFVLIDLHIRDIWFDATTKD